MICFVHIERAGGTTLHSILRNNYPLGYLTLRPWSPWTNDDSSAFSAREARFLVRAIPFMMGFGGHTTRSYLAYEEAIQRQVHYFTFVREPVSRYISHYKYQRYVMGIPWTIDRFLSESRFDNYMTRRIAGGDDLALAQHRLEHEFSFVGLAERFDESLLLMRNELGLPDLHLQYERRNATPKTEEHLGTRTLSLIRQRNHLDQRLYEFVTERLFPRYEQRYGSALSSALADQRLNNQGFRFKKHRRLAWGAYRLLVYQNLEFLAHKALH